MPFHVGDIGAQRVLTVTEGGAPLPITGATGMSVTVERPDGTTFVKAVSFVGTGADGRIQWMTTGADDLSIDGIYHDQVEMTLNGWTGALSKGTFQVYPVIG